MDLSNFKPTVLSDNGNLDITIREEKLPAVIQQITSKYSGNIFAVSEFIQGKKNCHHEFDYAASIIEFDRDNGIITFDSQDQLSNAQRYHVTGSLKNYSDLNSFHINGSKRWSVKELKDFLKMNRVYFFDKDTHRSILTNLESFKIKVGKVIEDIDDSRGNKRYLLAQEVTSDLLLDFSLTIPVFNGFNPSVFKVNVNYDIRDNAVEVWLESVELRELEMKLKNEIFDLEKEKLNNFTIIEK